MILSLSKDFIYGQSKAPLLGCSNLPQIYLKAIKITFALPKPDLSNYFLIYQYFIQPVYTQIFNKNPQLILSLIDL